MKVNTTKHVMRTAIELLLDTNPTKNNFAYNRSLTASPLCPCKETEETATHFVFFCFRLYHIRSYEPTRKKFQPIYMERVFT